MRLGRRAKGMSKRSRREMWRWVLSLPFDILGERPLWITLTYPGDWRPWVPDGRTLERHRRAFGEAWYRGFGEPPSSTPTTPTSEPGCREPASPPTWPAKHRRRSRRFPPTSSAPSAATFGTFGYQAGFKPTAELLEVDEDVWRELNRRLTRLESLRRHVKGRPLSGDAKRRRHWQGITAGELGREDYARLYAWAHATAPRRRGSARNGRERSTTKPGSSRRTRRPTRG